MIVANNNINSPEEACESANVSKLLWLRCVMDARLVKPLVHSFSTTQENVPKPWHQHFSWDDRTVVLNQIFDIIKTQIVSTLPSEIQSHEISSEGSVNLKTVATLLESRFYHMAASFLMYSDARTLLERIQEAIDVLIVNSNDLLDGKNYIDSGSLTVHRDFVLTG
jgi:hypothetical protein